MPFSITLHRVFKAPPDRVYRAFLDADALCKWLPPHGFTGHMQHFDPRVGGSYHMSFTQFSTGQSHGFSGTWHDLQPGRLIRYSNVFDDPGLPGELSVTVTLSEVFFGTEMTVVQSGIPDVIPEAGCLLGWHESLTLLALFVESGA